MKFSSKTHTIIPSSPIRSVEKFPLPQFLRNNGGNRSGTRKRYSHSAPMFSSVFRKKNNIETQEPSSPKVTCIGQVRGNKSKSKYKQTTTTNLSSCKWIQRVLFCKSVAGKSKTRQSTAHNWQRWLLSFKSSYQTKLKALEKSGKDPNLKTDVEGSTVIAPPPPKNALLLMRCRSEPHRENRTKIGDSDRENERNREERKDTAVEKEAKIMGRWSSGSSHPLILTRCKSEPAMRTGMLFPEASFWENNTNRRRRLGFHGNSQSHVS